MISSAFSLGGAESEAQRSGSDALHPEGRRFEPCIANHNHCRVLLFVRRSFELSPKIGLDKRFGGAILAALVDRVWDHRGSLPLRGA